MQASGAHQFFGGAPGGLVGAHESNPDGRGEVAWPSGRHGRRRFAPATPFHPGLPRAPRAHHTNRAVPAYRLVLRTPRRDLGEEIRQPAIGALGV
jgi:hypothetical protein